MSLALYLSLGVAVVLLALLVGFYVWVVRRNRREGTPGLVTRSRLTCPKCQKTFDYDYLPGASVTTVRLGTSRYMRCPLCHRWSVFDLSSSRVSPPEPAPPPGP